MKLKLLLILLRKVKEGSFKFIILFFCSLYYCLPNNIPLELEEYDFVYIDIVPLEISKNNIGLRNSKVNDEYRLSIHTQNFIADNLYFYGGFSPSLKDEVDIFYNLNFGYQSNLNYNRIKNLFFDFGYYSNRFLYNSSECIGDEECEEEEDGSEEFKGTSASLIFNIKFKSIHFLPSWSYIFNNENENNQSFINLDLLFNFNNDLVLKSALQVYDKNGEMKIFPSLSVKYKI